MKKEKIVDRLNHIMKAIGMDQAALSRAIGADRSMVSRWVRGHVAPSVRSQRLVANATGCNFEWLNKGEGPMMPGIDNLSKSKDKTGSSPTAGSDKTNWGYVSSPGTRTLPSLGECIELLVKIHNSGDPRLIMATHDCLSKLSSGFAYDNEMFSGDPSVRERGKGVAAEVREFKDEFRTVVGELRNQIQQLSRGTARSRKILQDEDGSNESIG